MDKVVENFELKNASRLSRLGAAIIDMLIIITLMVPLGYSLGAFDYIQTQEQPSMSTSLIMAAFGFIVFFAINGKLLAANGQTVGKKAMSIRIVALSGDFVPFKELLLKRYLPYFGFPYVPYIGGVLNLINVLWIFGKQSRCIHDFIAGTKVVES